MKIVLIHGKDTSPDEKWYPWFIRSVTELGISIVAPSLPKPKDPYLDEWVSELEKIEPNEDTILVGHSRGGVAILRWLEKLEEGKKVKKVILLGTNSGFLKDKAIPSENSNGFYSEGGYDFGNLRRKASEFIVLHSRDDKWVPFEQGEENAKGLGAKFLTFDDRGHFGKGIDEIPELLDEIKQSCS